MARQGKSGGGRTGAGKAVDKGTKGTSGFSGTRTGNRVAGSKGSGGAKSGNVQGAGTGGKSPGASRGY